MLLNSTTVAKYVKESAFSKRTQIGIDLSVKHIQAIVNNTVSFISKDQTTICKDNFEDLDLITLVNKKVWFLEKGAYCITFNEGIEVPEDASAMITHRSSLYRIGNIIKSPWWDPGFKCDNMSTTLIVNTPVFIEENARLAQITFWRNEIPVELYNGQFQGSSSPYNVAM